MAVALVLVYAYNEYSNTGAPIDAEPFNPAMGKGVVVLKVVIDDMSEKVDAAIERATSYLLSTVMDDGAFEYELRMENETLNPVDDYNVLRHGGTMYSIGDSCHTRHEENFASPPAYCDGAAHAMKLTAQWLQEEAIFKVPEADLFAVFEPNLSRCTSKEMLKEREVCLGGNGLTLVALCLANQMAGEGTASLQDMKEIGQFTIEYMQREDGTFYSLYKPWVEPYGPDDSFVSLYYPGEAALGLVFLFEALQEAGEIEASKYFLEVKHSFFVQQNVLMPRADWWEVLVAASSIDPF